MDHVIQVMEWFDKIGTIKTILFLCPIVIILLQMMYLVFVIASYSSELSIFEILSYVKYKVSAYEDKKFITSDIVYAWNRIHAVEKYSKHPLNLVNKSFKVQKVSVNRRT